MLQMIVVYFKICFSCKRDKADFRKTDVNCHFQSKQPIWNRFEYITCSTLLATLVATLILPIY